MRRINWEDAKASAVSEYRSMQSTIQLGEYLKDIPQTGFVKDNRTGEIIELAVCRKTTLNRLLSFIIKLYNIAILPEHREIILTKQKELELELERRGQ